MRSWLVSGKPTRETTLQVVEPASYDLGSTSKPTAEGRGALGEFAGICEGGGGIIQDAVGVVGEASDRRRHVGGVGRSGRGDGHPLGSHRASATFIRGPLHERTTISPPMVRASASPVERDSEKHTRSRVGFPFARNELCPTFMGRFVKNPRGRRSGVEPKIKSGLPLRSWNSWSSRDRSARRLLLLIVCNTSFENAFDMDEWRRGCPTVRANVRGLRSIPG